MYRALPSQLYAVADGAKRFYRDRWGIAESKIQVEVPIIKDISFVTTLHAVTRDFHWICIEVSERAYPDALDYFVLECKNRILPVKLYVAIPQQETSSFRADLARARKNGVGVIEVSESGVVILQEAMALSLTGVRAPEPKDFPAKYRQIISDAVATFQNGNPAKGCSVLYDELENLSRRIALKAQKNNFWISIAKAPNLKPEKDPWANIVKALMQNFDSGKSNCPDLKEHLFARVLGVTSHRNEVAHKPKTQRELKKRERELRTRFESVSDLLKDLVDASKPLRV